MCKLGQAVAVVISSVTTKRASTSVEGAADAAAAYCGLFFISTISYVVAGPLRLAAVPPAPKSQPGLEVAPAFRVL